MPGCRGVEIQRYGHGTICLFLRRWLHLRRPPSPAFFSPAFVCSLRFPFFFLFFVALSPYSFFLVDQEATDLGPFFFHQVTGRWPRGTVMVVKAFFRCSLFEGPEAHFLMFQGGAKNQEGNQAVWFFLC